MSDKQTELHQVVLRLAESGQFAQLTKYMLDLESRLQKLERVAAAAKASQLRVQILTWRLNKAADAIYTIIEQEIWRAFLHAESTALDNALRELDQP